MSDEIFLNGKTYASSKKAAVATGYAQDYVGQLARKGLIDAQRVGGHWYVLPESLEAYKRNTDALAPQLPTPKSAQDIDTIVSFDGKDYVSSSKAAKLTGYNPDYVGQLARAGKVLSRQVGNRWYVEREGLLAHKTQKDSLLASVQAEAAGLVRPQQPVPGTIPAEDRKPHLTYIREDAVLFPAMVKRERSPEPMAAVSAPTIVPIRVREAALHAPHMQTRERVYHDDPVRRPSGKTISKAVKVGAALTVVVMLSYGLTTMQPSATYALKGAFEHAGILADYESMSASAASTFDGFLAHIETWVTSEMRYVRPF